jgi:hypothetical protein
MLTECSKAMASTKQGSINEQLLMIFEITSVREEKKKESKP